MKSKESIVLIFLYQTVIGRFFLRIFISRYVTNLMGFFLKLKISRFCIPRFIKKNKIEKNRFIDKKYFSFNDYFERGLAKNINFSNEDLIAPSDGDLSIFTISENLEIDIKHSIYRVEELIQSAELAKKFDGGFCLIFRLSPRHYHRYHYFDDGFQEKIHKISGVFHTVRPIALRAYPVFSTNTREYTILKTNHFGDVLQMEIGALGVGKINNFHENYFFKKGEEKGHFSFGGSTILLLFQKNEILLNETLQKNLNQLKEISLVYGDSLGKAVTKDI